MALFRSLALLAACLATDAIAVDELAEALLLNVYDEPLADCGDPTQGRGSWGTMNEPFKCDEPAGGAHQICFVRIGQLANRFSLATGQSDWSTARAASNHCVCLGAWANYAAKREQGLISGDAWSEAGIVQIDCRATPKAALTEAFAGHWRVWNGQERLVEDQLGRGAMAFYEQCFAQATAAQREALTRNFCRFMRASAGTQPDACGAP